MKPSTAQSIPSTVSTKTDTITASDRFQTEQVLTISGGHFVNDVYTGFIPALLPVIIEKLSLSLTMAGSLTAVLQLPGIVNPLIGYLADRRPR